MTNIVALKKKLAQLEAEKTAILSKVSETSRKNTSARKYAIGGGLLKLAATDPKAYNILKQVWAMGEKDKPKAFEGEQVPPPPASQVPPKSEEKTSSVMP